MVEFFDDTASNTLVYDLPEPGALLAYLENATPLHNGYVAVPKTLRNLQVLRCFQLPVTPIVDGAYDWPIRPGRRPRDHQRTMTNFMVLHPRSFNLSDMGTMKTTAALWACDYLMTQYPSGTCRALIVAPLSILQRTWGDAIFSDLMGRRTYVIVHGSAEKRRELLRKPADFYLINHDGIKVGAKIGKRGALVLEGLSRDIADRKDIRLVAIDEATAFRDRSTMRSRVARHNLSIKDYVWPMTGTPTPQGPLDAHGLASLVNNAHNEPFTRYKERVMFRLSQWKWVPRPGAMKEAYKLLSPSIRFEMRECTDVPPSSTQKRDVELSAEQLKMYKELKRDLQVQLSNNKKITPANEAGLRQKLIQISCGCVYDHDHGVARLDVTPRLNELKAVIEEAGRKVIVLAPLTSVIHMLYEELKHYSRAMVNGEVPLKARNEIFRMFQEAKDPHILIADPGCMAHGLDLYAADVLVWFGATDRTELYAQGNRRIDRPGQTTCTTIVQLAATPVEREIYRRIEGNETMQGALLSMVKGEHDGLYN